MGPIKRLENIWDREKSYAIRYFIVFTGSVFIHAMLGIMFALSGRVPFAVMNGVSIVLYLTWLYFFSRRHVNHAMLLFPYLDVLVHVCVYNMVLGAAPAFFLYIFTVIPITFFLFIRDSKWKYPSAGSAGLSAVGILLTLITLKNTPANPLPNNTEFFQVNLLICALLLGTHTWEFLTESQFVQADAALPSEYDQLTGLRNRYSLSRDTASIHGTQYCVIMCDVDDFKHVNDLYGHTVGDTLLSLIGKTLQGCLRRDDIIYRWGGEEFLLVIKSDMDAARSAAERIRRKLSTVTAETDENAVSVTMTFGIADCMEEDSFEKVVAIAQSNMRRGKHCGKNCVVASCDESESVRRDAMDTALDTSGLTGAVFAAFAATSDSTYIYICNMSTNVSRWSKSAVDYFGLPGEYMYDAGNIWLGFVHPDDREAYARDIELVLSGKKRLHDVTYRARNKDGEYVTCVCKGVVTDGDPNHPTLFAGTMTNLGIVSHGHVSGR